MNAPLVEKPVGEQDKTHEFSQSKCKSREKGFLYTVHIYCVCHRILVFLIYTESLRWSNTSMTTHFWWI